MRGVPAAFVLALLLLSPAAAGAKDEAPSLAEAFGRLPSVWGASLSPDGSKISYLRMLDSGLPVALVYDRSSEQTTLLLASKRDEFDIVGCSWANHERLLCSFIGIARDVGVTYPTTRLVAVDSSGGGMKVLMQRRLRDSFSQYQDRIIDYLPDDPKRILITVPKDGGTGVSTLDIYSGRLKRVIRPRVNVRQWISDGQGNPRLRRLETERSERWEYRPADGGGWKRLRGSDEAKEERDYHPIGIGSGSDELLVFKPRDGRLALYSEDLARNRESRLVYAHPSVDLWGGSGIGKYQRLAGVTYLTDKPRIEYFDELLGRTAERLAKALPGRSIRFVDESWDKRLYLIHASSDRDPGTYYILEVEKSRCNHLASQRPLLDGRRLAEMHPIEYEASDGTVVPAYMTLPGAETDGPYPTIVLPHGGPQSRDVWGFDWLTQFLVANGFAVLQSNFRGSGGYGQDWVGSGGFKAWKLVVSDLEDGARAMVERGVADPKRMCVVGWSYGGYGALMSALEHPGRYRCAVSIAGVTDPGLLADDLRDYLGGREAAKELIGRSDLVLEEGSPRRRAGEIPVPVMLFHGDEDVNVSVDHSRRLARALRKKNRSVEYFEYEDAEHDLWNDAYRIDMLENMGRFLHQHLDSEVALPARAAANAQ